MDRTRKPPTRPIYLDYNATTPVDPKVLRAMMPYLSEHFGNPSSSHEYGRVAREAVDYARGKVAALIGSRPEDVLFTSGGTESDNHAIVGTALANRNRGRHVVTTRVEHPAVMASCRFLETHLGFRVTYLGVGADGLLDLSAVERAVTSETVLVTVMHANNETGTIERIAKVADIAHSRGALFHTDAAQSCGKIAVDVDVIGSDLLTVAGHKVYAPKGVGALYVRDGTAIEPFVHGAGQEHGLRAGTVNVPHAVGLGEACSVAKRELGRFSDSVKGLRDALHRKVQEGIGQERLRLNGHPARRLPNTLNVSISGVVGEELLGRIPQLATSTGAACHSGSLEPSRVLVEMGLSKEEALGAVRLSLGRFTSRREVDEAAKLIVRAVEGGPSA